MNRAIRALARHPPFPWRVTLGAPHTNPWGAPLPAVDHTFSRPSLTVRSRESACLGCMGFRRFLAIWHVLLLTVGAVPIGGCSTAPTALPDASKLPENVLSKEEVKSKISAMAAMARTRQGDAAKLIEKDP